jgi:hypothetical protein
LGKSESSDGEPGPKLIEMGWRMGSLMPPLVRGIVRSSATPPANGEFHGRSQDGSPPHVLTYEFSGPPGSFLVVSSQTCDIARAVNLEPVVEAMRVQVVTKKSVLDEMRRSERRFVLDADRGFVASAPIKTYVDKAFLLEITPIDGCKDEETRRSFATWLAMRSLRAAHPDEFVSHIRRPLLEKLKDLRLARDVRMVSVDACRLRVFPPDTDDSPPPYEVELYFVLPDSAMVGTEDAARILSDIASVVTELRSALDGRFFSVFSWHANPLNEMTAQDFIDTDEIQTE